ncbi:MAG: T9SS type A sorting domain-containing protein [Bacteroidales bacterium]|nr:T9SS type A sorting domain-containing protein [Bacteroidales bacterium]MBN2763405.1 T9SS type A sorting domain-containing protein [Bacteroidales bacterium]
MRRGRNEYFGLYIVLLGISGVLNAQSITIDMDSVYQTIRGFGGIHITSWQGRDLNENMCKKAFDNDPGELGLSILRLQIDPDSGRFYTELDIARYAVEKGAIVFASPWDPPAEMLDPASSQHRLHEDYYDDYAAHLTRYYTCMNDSGVPVYAISVQNEPDYAGGWTSWTQDEMIRFLEENAQSIPTRVMAPESFQFRRPYTDALLNDAEANANFDIVGGHIYGGGLFDYPLAREKGKEVWMTEHYTSSDRSANLWPDALLVGNEITDCMQANFNAYIWWYIRRFYGLITDDGSVSKRGYVFSHFSKFIRPGAERVNTEISSAAGIDATAFKTDSGLVIVVVNSNQSAVELNFEIQDGSIDTLTKFTTSVSKNLVNDGGASLTGGLFTAVVDPQSITTFTSHADNAGRFGNLGPDAFVSEDLEVTDTDGDGYESFHFTAAACTDPDGILADYSWAFDGLQVSTDTICDLMVRVGEHELVLSVTDNDGARDCDTVSINVISIKNTNLYLEAECGIVGSTWLIEENLNASHGEYVMAPIGTQSLGDASANAADHILFNFHLEEDGTYKLWGRVITPSADDDSYWVKMDNGTWIMWNSIPTGGNWHWDDLHNSNAGSNVVEFELDTGYHTLSICYREDGALLDKLLLSNTGFIPEGMGDTATNCPDEIPDYIHDPGREHSPAVVFPNPATDEIQVHWRSGFTTLQLVGIDGRLMLHKEFSTPVQQEQLSLNLEPGFYFLVLRNANKSQVAKILIE